MTRLGRYFCASLVWFGVGLWTTASAQGECLNEDQFPADPITAPELGETALISECSYEVEHSVITGIIQGAIYEFTLSTGGYITVRSGTYDGPVVGEGWASVALVANSADDLFPHWNVNSSCATATNCVVTNVTQLVCMPPLATRTFVQNCNDQNYTIDLDITTLGDASAVDLIIMVGEEETVIPNVGVGLQQLGPFGFSDVVSITLQNVDDESCSRVLPGVVYQTTCPLLITCGAPVLPQEYCYTANDDRSWLYTSVGTGTLRLRFVRGTIESSTYDNLRIYDGTDNTGTLLFEHTATDRRHFGPVGSALTDPNPTYYGVDVFATSNSIYMEVNSDNIIQCGSEGYDTWEWQVSCLDCELPEVSYTVVDDCANDQFTIHLDITSLGDAPSLNFDYTVDGSDPNTASNLGLGEAEIGPFPIAATVNMVAIHPGSALCHIELGDITATGTCPLLIECGAEVLDSTCYANWSDQRYYYQGTGTYPLAVFFDGGQLFFGDSVMIYDGGSIDSPLLFQGTDQDLQGVFHYTTNPEHRLTIRVRADGFTSCDDGSTDEQVAWRVACLDCVPPTAEFSIVQDCENFQYFIDVVVTDLGSDPEPQIGTSISQELLEITATGTYQIGPFVSGTELEVTIINDANSLCNIYSGNMVNPICPVLIDCPGPTLVENYCYTNYDTTAWAYELNGLTGTLRLTFVRGTIESSTYDKLRIYDGADNTAPLLFEHTATARRHLGPVGSALLDPAPEYSTVDVTSSSGNLYMEMTSDISVNCTSDQYDPWEWEVYCLNCSAPTATFNLVENCVSREYTAEVIITDAGATDPLTATNLTSGESLTGLGVGVHTFGPYPVNEENVFRVFNEAYEQCRLTSDTLTYTSEECISVTCGFDNYTHCYGNNEDRWYTYRSAQNVQLTLAFLGGQMISGDRITLYNGADETAAVIYTGINGGNLTGFAVPSGNSENTLTLRIESNDAGSCEDGVVTTPLSWTVACGGVGINEAVANTFSLYPNPTNGLLNIAFTQAITGGAQVRVLDMSGRMVLDQPLTMVGSERNTIDLRGLQHGNYMVQITTTDWVSTQRVQVAR